jgi:hypothetical protein
MFGRSYKTEGDNILSVLLVEQLAVIFGLAGKKTI